MRIVGSIGVVVSAAVMLTLVTVACVGSNSTGDPSPSENDPNRAEGGSTSGTSGGPNCSGPEMCGNKVDDNCNGQVDEGCDCSGIPEGATRACGQNGPGICTLGVQTCKEHEWGPCSGVAAHATEDTCDGVDENCNGEVDEGLKITCLRDADGDGYGSSAPAGKKEFCPVTPDGGAPDGGDAGDGGDPNRCPDGYITRAQSLGDDCNDEDEKVKPGVAELCDSVDSDCDGKPRNTCPSGTETYGALAQTGVIGINTITGGCGTRTYASDVSSCTASAGAGLTGYSGGAFSGPTRIALLCNDGVISETTGVPEYTYKLTTNGVATAASFTGARAPSDVAGTTQCAADQWLVGLKHTRSCLLDRMSVVCAPMTFERVGSSFKAVTGPTTTTYVLGNPASGFAESTYLCPSGAVITSITAWYLTTPGTDQNYISGFQVGCKPLGFTPQ